MDVPVSSGVSTTVYFVLGARSIPWPGAVKVMFADGNDAGAVKSVHVDVGWSEPATVHTFAETLSPSASR